MMTERKKQLIINVDDIDLLLELVKGKLAKAKLDFDNAVYWSESELHKDLMAISRLKNLIKLIEE